LKAGASGSSRGNSPAFSGSHAESQGAATKEETRGCLGKTFCLMALHMIAALLAFSALM